MDRILIVENEKEYDVLNKKLTPFYDVEFVGSVKEAIDRLRGNKGCFSCLMINISMENENAIELLAFMVKDNIFDDVSVAIAVENFDDIDENIMKYNISEIIQKPYGMYTLVKRLDNIINLNKQKNELRLSNIELVKAYDKAKKAIELKSRFLLNTSHDIRTPMNAIIGMTDMAKKYIDDRKKAEKCIDNVMTASDHLLNILNDIINMTYIEKEQMSYNIIECSLGNIIDEVSVIIRQQCDNKNLKFELKIHNIINECIWTNPTRLKQVFINILSNSIKYTNSGGVIGLDISEKVSDRKDFANYIMRFYDNGTGMSKEFVENVFVPFAREENMSTPYVEGTGLGMAITKSIIDSMGGTIDVISKEGIGTQITIGLQFKKAGNIYQNDARLLNSCIYVYDMNKEEGRSLVSLFDTVGADAYYHDNLMTIFESGRAYNVLVVSLSRMDEENLDTLFKIKIDMPHIKIIQLESPMYKISRDVNMFDAVVKKPFFPLELMKAISNALIEKNQYNDDNYHFDNLRILVVDDNMINRMLLAEFLEAVGVKAVETDCGMKAVELLETAEKDYFDMVLMDIQMPEMDGFEATRRIRKLEKGYHRYVPIVAVSAEAFSEEKTKANEAGMNDYLCKPFKREELYKCIEKYTGV